MLQLSGQPLSLHEIATIADASVRIQIDPAAIAQMDASRDVVRRVAEARLPVYGINTRIKVWPLNQAYCWTQSAESCWRRYRKTRV